MSPQQMHNLLDTLEHALADLAPDVREPIDQALNRLTAAYIDRVTEVEGLREQLQDALLRQGTREELFRRLWEAQPS